MSRVTSRHLTSAFGPNWAWNDPLFAWELVFASVVYVTIQWHFDFCSLFSSSHWCYSCERETPQARSILQTVTLIDNKTTYNGLLTIKALVTLSCPSPTTEDIESCVLQDLFFFHVNDRQFIRKTLRHDTTRYDTMCLRSNWFPLFLCWPCIFRRHHQINTYPDSVYSAW